MNELRVLAVCLTANRTKMTRRAVASFNAQTYQNKRMLIWDTGELNDDFDSDGEGGGSVVHLPAQQDGFTIGALRNAALSFWTEYDIAVTWDSDDYSHPNRIAEQVAHLQASGADAVGYNELLFWRDPIITEAHAETASSRIVIDGLGEAWLYKTASIFPPPGTTLCYWRKTWERKPFPDLPKGKGGTGEDHAWCKGLNVATTSSVIMDTLSTKDFLTQPRMVASIHGGNTMPYDLEAQLERGAGTNWKRAPQLDEYCRERMAL